MKRDQAPDASTDTPQVTQGPDCLPDDLATAILNGPRNPSRTPRTSPRTAEDRQIDHTRNVTYTIAIGKANLPRAT